MVTRKSYYIKTYYGLPDPLGICKKEEPIDGLAFLQYKKRMDDDLGRAVERDGQLGSNDATLSSCVRSRVRVTDPDRQVKFP